MPSVYNMHYQECSTTLAIVEQIKVQAKSAERWNLFLPGLRDDEPGTRLTNLEYAPLAEIMGRIPWAVADLSAMFNPVLRGWHQYYGRFYESAMSAGLVFAWNAHAAIQIFADLEAAVTIGRN